MYIIGLMSGTSLDGVDAVLVNFSEVSPKLIQKCYLSFSFELKHQLLELQQPTENELHLSQLVGNILTQYYANAVEILLKKSNLQSTDIAAIGCHGQTIRHRPEHGYTFQIGNPALLAELTDINVVSHFRDRDIAAGGQGAPLVPAFHAEIFAHPQVSRAVINIGGISNITYLPHRQKAIQGFDCGPGNIFMDFWINKHQQKSYDQEGQWALKGNCIPELLLALLEDPFFHLAPPKSTGRDLFNPHWLNKHLQYYLHYSPVDIQATLLALTVESIAKAIEHYQDIEEVYLCGGGAYNIALLSLLQKRLPGCIVDTTKTLGVAPDEVEALAFAWLAYQNLNKAPANIPSATGAQGPRILGYMTLA